MSLIDNYGKDCGFCHRGRYVETNFFDDMDGTLHCDACGEMVKRYYEMTDREKLEIVIGLLKKIVGPYTYEDDINCLDDALILAREALDKIGEAW
jgi:hypothetical protein